MAGLSLNPETFVSGGLLDDANVTFAKSEFRIFTYPGGMTTAALVVTMDDGEHDASEQVYSCGKPEDFQPSADGRFLEPAPGSSKTAIGKNSNLSKFIESLCNAGFDSAKLASGDAKAIEGIRAHVVRKNFGKSRNSDKDIVVLVVESLLDSAPAGNSKPNSSPAGNSAPVSDDETVAVELLSRILGESGGSIEKGTILPAAMKLAKAENLGNGFMKHIVTPAFLSKNFKLEGTVVSFQ